MTLDAETARGAARARFLRSRAFLMILGVLALLFSLFALDGRDPQDVRATPESSE